MTTKTSSEQLIDTFLRYIRSVRRYSEHTVTAYGSDLLQCASFLRAEQGGVALEAAEKPHLRAFVLALLEDELKARTLNRKLSALKAFYGYLMRHHDGYTQNPAQLLKTIKIPAHLPSFAKEDDLGRLLDQTAFSDDFKGQRDRMVLLLLYGGGLRRGELLTLKEEDFDARQSALRVLGKRQKLRVVPLPKPLTQEIEAYLQLKHARFPSSSTYLLLDDQGRPLYPMWVYRLVRRYLGTLSQLEKRSPHVLRHSYATHLLNRGADLNAIKELLGHSSLAATQFYTHTNLRQLKKVYKRSHPRS